MAVWNHRRLFITTSMIGLISVSVVGVLILESILFDIVAVLVIIAWTARFVTMYRLHKKNRKYNNK